MIINGSITIVTDPNMLQTFMNNGFKVIYIGENPNVPQEFIRAAVLLPPYEVLECEINNDMNSYRMLYENYLASNKACFDMFAVMLIAIKAGTNIALYAEEGNNLNHLQFIINHMITVYGIVPCTGIQNPFMYNEAYDDQNATIIYSYMDGFMSTEELFDCIKENDFYAYLKVVEGIPYTDPLFRLVKVFQSRGLLNLDQNTLDPIPFIAEYFRRYKLAHQFNIQQGPQQLINFDKKE